MGVQRTLVKIIWYDWESKMMLQVHVSLSSLVYYVMRYEWRNRVLSSSERLMWHNTSSLCHNNRLHSELFVSLSFLFSPSHLVNK
jgi:hypothetical protein